MGEGEMDKCRRNQLGRSQRLGNQVRCVLQLRSELRYTRTTLTHLIVDMHPLAVEDILHCRKNARSKADYYTKHLFLRVLCHTLDEDANADADVVQPISALGIPRSSSPGPMRSDTGGSDSFDKDQDVPGGEQWITTGPSLPMYTSRSSTLRNTIGRRATKQADIETAAMPELSYARLSPDTDPNVRTAQCCTGFIGLFLTLCSVKRMHATRVSSRSSRRVNVSM